MPGDAISVAPHNYKTIFENDRVRLLEYSGKAGDKTEMHSHPDILAYPLTAAKVNFTLANGQSSEAEMQAGETMFQEGHDHSTELLGDDARVLLFELE